MKVEVKGEVEAEKVTIGKWELRQVGLHGSEKTPVYSLKNSCIEIRFLPGTEWFDLRWLEKDELCYCGGVKFSANPPHLFNLHIEEA
jgi:hypothetical protein